MLEKVKKESHTRLYLSAKNILKNLSDTINRGDVDTRDLISRLIAFLKHYPADLMIGVMKDMKNSYPLVYQQAIEDESFVEAYFATYSAIR